MQLIQIRKQRDSCQVADHLLSSLLVALPLLKAGMGKDGSEDGRIEGGGDVHKGAAGLLYPAMPLLKMGCKNVGVCCALSMHQRGTLHNALSACQIALLEVPSVPCPEFCKPTATLSCGTEASNQTDSFECNQCKLVLERNHCCLKKPLTKGLSHQI